MMREAKCYLKDPFALAITKRTILTPRQRSSQHDLNGTGEQWFAGLCVNGTLAGWQKQFALALTRKGEKMIQAINCTDFLSFSANVKQEEFYIFLISFSQTATDIKLKERNWCKLLLNVFKFWDLLWLHGLKCFEITHDQRRKKHHYLEENLKPCVLN